MSELHPDWDLSHLEQFRTSLAQRDRVEQMAKELADLQKRAETAALQHKDKEAKLKSDLQELERLKAIPPAPQLEKLTRRAGQYRADQEQLEQLDDQLAELDGQIAQLRRQIAGPLGIAPERDRIAAGAADAAVQQFVGHFPRRSKPCAKPDESTSRPNGMPREVKKELLQFDTQQHVPDRKALTAQRNRRDDGWRLDPADVYRRATA